LIIKHEHTNYINIKHLLIIAFIALFTYKAVAQKKTMLEENYSIKPGVANALNVREASEYIGKKKFICGRVVSFEQLNKASGICSLVDENHKYTLYIIVPLRKFKPDTGTIVGHMICVDGRIERYKGKPAIFVKKANQLGHRITY